MMSSSGHMTTGCAISNDKTKVNALNDEQDVTPDLKNGPNTAPPSIFIAAAAGNQALLEQLYSAGADMYVITDDGCNALHAAARAGREQATKYLLGLGVPSVLNKNNRLPVHEAALSGNWSTLKLLLDHRKILPETSKINYPTACSSFLFPLVLKSEQCDMIRNWVKYTGLHMIKEKDLTILHHAAQLKDASVLSMLLSYEVFDINKMDSRDYAPIHYAARNKNTDLLRQLLLQPDVQVNGVSQKRHSRKESALQIAIRRNNLDTFNMLLEDHRLCWRGGLNAPTMELHTCKDYCRWNMWKLLIRHHWADETNNECLLLNASLNGDENKVIELLAQGSSTYHDYPNPLHCAIAAGHDNIAQLLLKRAKGFIHESLWEYFDPMDVAVSNNDERMVSFLLENSGSLHRGTYNLTPEVMYHGSLSMVKMLFSWSGFDPGCMISCLQYRRVKDTTQTLKLLLNDPRVTTKIEENPKVFPLMHYAVRCEGTEYVELLLNDRIRPYIDINATEYFWSKPTALDVAIGNKRTDLIGLLRSHGAKTCQEL